MKNYHIKQRKRLRQSKVILLVGIVIVIVAPFLFIRDFGIISFEETGQIGDTIGGITAPIVNLVGAILVNFMNTPLTVL